MRVFEYFSIIEQKYVWTFFIEINVEIKGDPGNKEVDPNDHFPPPYCQTPLYV